MKITIMGLDESFRRTIELLLDLFYEDATYHYEQGSYELSQSELNQSELNQSELNQSEQNHQHVVDNKWSEEEEQLLLSFHVTYTAENKGICSLSISEKTTRDQQIKKPQAQATAAQSYEEQFGEETSLKRALQHVTLKAFEERTGIKQAWGILTGIRPTKLFYQKAHEHKNTEQIKQELQHEYGISQEKLELMERITERQLTVLPDLHQLQDEVSIYIGIPFCPTKCAYCTFPAYDINGLQGSVFDFLKGLHFEMEQIGSWLQEHNKRITTIYFGGGTPTSIEAEQMDALYAHMYRVFPELDKVREITVEAGRPDTITPDKLEVLKKHRIDRISINPQSYSNQTLEAIGRHHSVEETIEKYQLARAFGFSNINMDLIIGLPGEGLEALRHSLAETEKLMPESLTVHTLSFKRASKMTKNKEKYKVADREEVVRMMQLAEDWTQQKGYNPYYLYRQKNILGNLENVGYALPGQESLYNIIIMEEVQTIIGLGCGASSKWVSPFDGKISRFANPKEPRAYNLNYESYTTRKLEQLEALYRQP